MGAEIARVLMTADTIGGVWTYTLDLARALATHHIQTTLATMGSLPTSGQLARARTIPGLNVVTSEFQLEWMDAPWHDVAAAGDWLLELEAQLAPDIIHLNGYAHAALPFHAPVVVVAHSCLLSWADAIPGAIDRRKLDDYRMHVLEGIRLAHHVVAPSAAMMAAVQRHYGPLARTSVIPNGRSTDLFAPGRKERFVLTAGRLWDRAKKVEAIAAIAPRLPWPVAVAGDGASRQPGVHTLGPLSEPELAGWLARAPIFALPARYEPFGLLPLEAALSGCALVLGDIPSLREVWGDAADYAHPEDHDALQHAIVALTSSSRLKQRSDAAREHAARYSVSRMGEAYRSMYEAVRLNVNATSCAEPRSVACAL
jgi:glycogen(starch) synthase